MSSGGALSFHPPPDGDRDRGYHIIITQCIFLSVCTGLVVARLATRRLIVKTLGLDDLFIVLALVSHSLHWLAFATTLYTGCRTHRLRIRSCQNPLRPWQASVLCHFRSRWKYQERLRSCQMAIHHATSRDPFVDADQNIHLPLPPPNLRHKESVAMAPLLDDGILRPHQHILRDLTSGSMSSCGKGLESSCRRVVSGSHGARFRGRLQRR